MTLKKSRYVKRHFAVKNFSQFVISAQLIKVLCDTLWLLFDLWKLLHRCFLAIDIILTSTSKFSFQFSVSTTLLVTIYCNVASFPRKRAAFHKNTNHFVNRFDLCPRFFPIRLSLRLMLIWTLFQKRRAVKCEFSLESWMWKANVCEWVSEWVSVVSRGKFFVFFIFHVCKYLIKKKSSCF